MAVIKSRHSDRILHNAVVLDLGDLNRQAEEMIEQAEAKASVILADAREEAARLVGEASGQGHEEGLTRGLEEGRAQGAEQARADVAQQLAGELETLTGRLTEIASQWEGQREDLLLRAREDVLVFAFALGEKIAKRAIAREPDTVCDQLVAALALLMTPTSLRIAVHPDDHSLLEEMLPRVHESLNAGAQVTLVEDASIERGGCMLATAGGEIDATIATQIRRLAEALLPDRTRDDDRDGSS